MNSWPRAVLVDYRNEVVKECDVMGKAHILPVHPKRETPLDTSRPHRMDFVGRRFEIEGKAGDGETWIYRERFWEVTACDCQTRGR